MTRKLNIAPNLSVPIDAITQRISVLGRTGSGKSHTAGVIVEEVLAHHQQVVILDPKGDFWGLRASADGKSEGYPIIVFGGEHGDIPLDPASGNLVADLIIREGISAVLDFSSFESKAEEIRFATDFADRLYRKNRKAMLLVLDESDSIMPQSPGPEEKRMLGKFDVICRRGRSRGIGVLLISQRSAAVHKGGLSQTEVMVAHQTTSPHDRKAIELWVKGKGTEEQQAHFMNRLASLKVGEAILWSPSWLNVFKEIKVRAKRTFDSSATPTVGRARRAPKILAKVDLDRIKATMAATLEKAKREDVKLLNEQITALQAELRKRDFEIKKLKAAPLPKPIVQQAPAKEVVKTKTEKVEVPVLGHREFKGMEKLVGRMEKLQSRLSFDASRFEVMSRSVWPEIAEIRKKLDAGAATVLLKAQKSSEPVGVTTGRMQTARPNVAAAPRPEPQPKRVATLIAPKRHPEENGESGEIQIKAGARRMLQTLATFQHVKLSRRELGVLSRISPTSGTFSSYLSDINKAGYVALDRDGVVLTKEGLDYLDGDFPKNMPEPDARVALWDSELKQGERAMLKAIYASGMDGLTRQELSDATGIVVTSGTFSSYLSTLRRNALFVEEGKKLKQCSAFLVGYD